MCPDSRAHGVPTAGALVLLPTRVSSLHWIFKDRPGVMATSVGELLSSEESWNAAQTAKAEAGAALLQAALAAKPYHETHQLKCKNQVSPDPLIRRKLEFWQGFIHTRTCELCGTVVHRDEYRWMCERHELCTVFCDDCGTSAVTRSDMTML
eukprot:TRINITY_DN54292_c0_g1_i1.p1 TRINITY_DN54292_c0_g1~~TRINITY_DN54292_c0_g1_i1.p1  ORF type:complete len:172 (+),score=11.38 TRINITY_DN54292_c0_g1_i1:62-517(+)